MTATCLRKTHNSFHEFESMMRDNVASLGHFRLFKEEILKTFVTTDDLIHLTESLGIQVKRDNFETVKEDMWEIVSNDVNLMKDLVSYACQKDDELSQKIYLPIPDGSCSYYTKFFSDGNGLKMEAIVKSLEVSSVIAKLSKSEYSSIINEVERRVSEGKHLEASCYLMRSLPYVISLNSEPAAWYFDFLNACLSDPSNTTYKIKTEISKDIVGQDNELEVVNEKNIDKLQRRSQIDFEVYRDRRFPKIYYQEICDPEKIHLYLFQEELVLNAEKGINTIICSPTGSGKTVVAAHIILNHLSMMKKNGEIGRVAMLVPTVPLVEQQSTILNTYLRKIYWVEGMSGSEPLSRDGRASYILASDIVVLTPQIFINLIRNIRKDDRLFFTDFSMLIFDECHHCDGDHPYSVLMRMLHDFQGPKPQIIGLTASIPVGSGGLNPEAALNHMLELCARLSAHCITTVRKCKDDLKLHVTPPFDGKNNFLKYHFEVFQLLLSKIIRAEKPARNKLTEEIVGRMVEIEEDIKNEFNNLCEKSLFSSREKNGGFPTQQHSESYGSFIGILKADVIQMKNCDFKIKLSKKLDVLRAYHSALCLNDLLPDAYAYKYLLKNLEDDVEDQFKQNMAYLKESSFGGDNEKDILKKLHAILKEKYSEEPDSRTIIFVATRLLAEELADHLNCSGVLKKRRLVGHLTSSNQKSAVNGQSSSEQRRMIKYFNDGQIKVLVATSVAEEGLDISACNLIIKYNNTGSEMSLIQRRGRGRAKNSRSVLLVLNESVEEKELENIQKELLMHRCLEHIQTKTEEQMRKLVDEKIELNRKIRETERAEREERKFALQNRSFDLFCRMCHAFICKSCDMRVSFGDQYVCCDPEIWGRVTVKTSKNSKKTLDIATAIAKLYCNGCDGVYCGEELGSVVKLFGAFLPSISARSITIGNQEEPIFKYKKWDSIVREMFFVESLTERDLECMLKSVKKKEFDQWEAEALLAVERAAKLMKKNR